MYPTHLVWWSSNSFATLKVLPSWKYPRDFGWKLNLILPLYIFDPTFISFTQTLLFSLSFCCPCSLLNACFIFLFLSAADLKVLYSAAHWSKCLGRKMTSVNEHLEGLFIHIQLQKIYWSLLNLMWLCWTPLS